MGFRLQQKSILNDLERQFTAFIVISFMRIVTKRLGLIFLVERYNCIASSIRYCHKMLSVCLSVVCL